LNCDFDFYGKMPVGDMDGSVFLNCLFRSHVGKESESMQFITKRPGHGAIIDGRFLTDEPSIRLGWARNPPADLRCYQYNVTLNGKSVLMNADSPGVSVALENYPALLKAYKFTYNGETIYNTYNLLRGADNWDPMGVKNKALAASTPDIDLGSIPVRMTVTASQSLIETGTGQGSLTTAGYSVLPAGNPGAVKNAGSVVWSIFKGQEDYASATPDALDEAKAVITASNRTYASVPVVVEAVSSIGLHAAFVVRVNPLQLPAPGFTINGAPSLSLSQGRLKVSYVLDLSDPALEDCSEIIWYRCDGAEGVNPVPVSVTRHGNPEKEYELVPGDAGKFIMASVAPRHSVSPAGSAVSVIYGNAILGANVQNPKRFYTGFHNFPASPQTKIIPGYWTIGGFRPSDGSQPAGAMPSQQRFENGTALPPFTPVDEAWSYAMGQDNASFYGLLQTTRGARLLYTPPEGLYGDMSLTLVVAPEKTLGQGFGGANQYMDVGIKLNTATLTGYALRIERINVFSNAVVMNLVEYKNGVVSYLTHTGGLAIGRGSLGVSAYLTDCTIELNASGTLLTAKVRSSSPQLPEHVNAKYTHEVDLRAEITPNKFGGIQIQHTGTNSNGNRTLLRSLEVLWR
jgi:hypothetical protein